MREGGQADGLDSYASESHPARMNWRDYITYEPGKRSGQPCIRGLRLTPYDILEYLAGGMTPDDIVADFPELTHDDIRAVLAFAADRERRAAGVAAE